MKLNLFRTPGNFFLVVKSSPRAVITNHIPLLVMIFSGGFSYTFRWPHHGNRNLKISKVLLKSQAHQGTSLFTSAGGDHHVADPDIRLRGKFNKFSSIFSSLELEKKSIEKLDGGP